MPISPDKVAKREYEVPVTFYVVGGSLDEALGALSDFLTIAYIDRGREFDIADYETHEEEAYATGRST